MDLIVRQIDLEKDHDTLVSWWEFWKFPVMPKKALPDIGLMVQTHLEEPVCAGFLYTTKSTLGWIEWIVASMVCSKEERSAGLDMLLDGLELRANAEGTELLFTSCKQPNLTKRYKEHGWIETETNMSNFIKRLGE